MTLRLAIGLLWLSCGWMTSQIDHRIHEEGPFEFDLDNSLYRILGSAKEAVGDTLFLKADEYFHGGVTEGFHEEGGVASKEGYIEDEPKRQAPSDWIAWINERVMSHEHFHLDRDNQKEMLPFFALSTALDPYNVEAVLTTAYWLDRQFGKTDEAIGILEQGIEDNPNSWEIEGQLADIYFKRKKEYALSEGHYREAIRKSAGQTTVETHYRVDMHYHLAEVLLVQGKKPEALKAYQDAVSYYEDKHPPALKDMILKKIQELSGSAHAD